MLRRLGIAVVATAALAAPTAAAAKTIRVDWREQKTLTSGGALQFRVTKIVATPRSWAVTATITNASTDAVAIDHDGTPLRFDPGYPLWLHGFALIHSRRSSGKFGFTIHYEWLQATPSFIRPALPAKLAKGASWTGTFGGAAKLKPGEQYHVGFGVFLPETIAAGGDDIYWITDHWFKL